MVGRTGSDGMEIASVTDVGAPKRRPSGRPWMQIGAALAAVAVVVAAAVVVADDGDGTAAKDTEHPTKVVTDPAAQRTVAAALGTSTGTGGYEVSYDFVIDPPAQQEQVCQDVSDRSHGALVRSSPSDVGTASSVAVPTTVVGRGTVCYPSGQRQVTVNGHGVVHLNPYLLETTSTVSGLGEVAVKTDGTQIVEVGGGNYGSLNDGQPLSGFAGLVEGTFGQGPGALTMLGLASPTGYLSLSADAVTGVTAVGTGVVNGVPVTYYDVVSDTAAMQQLPGLTDQQRKTIGAALAVLETSGFEEAHGRIAIDGAGYIRESTSTATFSDGTKMTRHMTLSSFGCIGAGPTPVNPTGAPENLPPECTTTTTTVPGAGASTTTTTLPLDQTTSTTVGGDGTTTTTSFGTTSSTAPTTTTTLGGG